MGDSGLDTDTFNIISGARLSGSSTPRYVQRAMRWYEGRPFSWWVLPGDLPDDLPSVLNAAGLRRVQEAEAMACDLERLAAEPRGPADLSVSRVRSPADLRVFAEILASLTDPPDSLILGFYASAAPHLLHVGSPLRLYLGRRGGTPVATSEVTVAYEVAGLYNVSTVKSERGKGIGTAMTVLPLLEARKEGIPSAVLQAEGDAKQVYARVGFVEVGVVAEYRPRTASISTKE